MGQLGCTGLDCTGQYKGAELGCTGLYLAVLGCTKCKRVIRAIKVFWMIQVFQFPGGLGDQDNMYLENIWFSWSKPSNCQEKLRCYACDGWRKEETRLRLCSSQVDKGKSDI